MFIITFPVVFSIVVHAVENEKVSGYFSSYLPNSDYVDSISKQLSNNKNLSQLPNLNPKQTIDLSSTGQYLSGKSNATDNKPSVIGTVKSNEVNKLSNYDYNMLMNSNTFLPVAISQISNYYTYMDPKAQHSISDDDNMFSNNSLKLNNLTNDISSQVSIDTHNSSTKYLPVEKIEESVNKFLEDYGVKQLSEAYKEINGSITPNRQNMTPFLYLDNDRKEHLYNLTSSVVKCIPRISDIVINQRQTDLTNAFNKYNLISALNKYESDQTNISNKPLKAFNSL